MAKPVIGFVGQGFVGKSYADDFEARGYAVVRYALEEPYRTNREKVGECDIVFIAVPTPTVPADLSAKASASAEAPGEGGQHAVRFDVSIVREGLSLVGAGKTAVIKSTILPGTTEMLQQEFPALFLMHSPEFLLQKTAAHDAAHPVRNIIGIPVRGGEHGRRAKELLALLPKAPFEIICGAREAELVKYAGNCLLYHKVLFANMLYDLAAAVDADYDTIARAVAADPRIGPSHLEPVHEGGRGAGGACFIKDFAAFTALYKNQVGDTAGVALNHAAEQKNIDLLLQSGKDRKLLEGVYGNERLKRHQ